MIEPKLDDEVKFEFHGYFYARPEDHQKIADYFTVIYNYLASEGIAHNFLERTTLVDWEDPLTPLPIFENESDMPESVDDEVKRARLWLLEVTSIRQKIERE